MIGEYAVVSGTVTYDTTALGGVLVTAQTYDALAGDEKDKVVVHSSTTTDDDGQYTMYLEPGTYNIVAYQDGYDPDCAVVLAESNTSHTQDFTLTTATASNGTITGDVTTAGSLTLTLSFRMLGACGGGEQIELTWLGVNNGEDYTVDLPPGQYSIVAYTDTETWVFGPVDVTATLTTTQDIDTTI